jgi:hypothetical protein
LAEVYYYVPAKEVEYIVECGLSLSRWHNKEVIINGINKKCISAFINPKDDMKKYNDSDLICIKLNVPSNYCYVADKYLYDIGLDIKEVMEFYLSSLMPIEEYIFGFHRLPECLVTTTVIQGQIGIMKKAKDSPVLINCSEELYINNLIELNREKYPDFEDVSLYHFYSSLINNKKINKIEDKKKRIAVFKNEELSKPIIIKMPK